MSPSGDHEADTEFETAFEDATVVSPPDDVFRALSEATRRRILSLLIDGDRRDVQELVDMLVGWQATIDGPAGPAEWDTMQTELIHSHLPILSDAGLITYDPASDTVELASVPGPIRTLLSLAEAYERTWSRSDRQGLDTESR